MLSIFAKLIESKAIEPEKLSKVKVLLMKEFLIYGLEKSYAFKNSEILTLDLSEIARGSFESRLRHKKKEVELDLKSFMDDRSLAK